MADSQKMRQALEEILDTVTEHPCFNPDIFESRDIDALIDIGGVELDYTRIAILAADALEDG